MLDRVLELNLKLRSLARMALYEGYDEDLLEEFSEVLKEIYEEIGSPDKANAGDILRAEPKLGLKMILTNLSEDLSDFLYKRIGSEWDL
ncbi:MAG: hypothetical protein RMI85_04685 [Candidatus Korarchaeum sp.]|nr:hypothetical protein [Candidatus Korarchaeum sp.]